MAEIKRCSGPQQPKADGRVLPGGVGYYIIAGDARWSMLLYLVQLEAFCGQHGALPKAFGKTELGREQKSESEMEGVATEIRDTRGVYRRY